MKILLLTQWFDPEPTFKGLAFAIALRDAGHEVEVITGFPNYPGGKIYPGYRMRWHAREELDGIRINRVALYPSHDGSAIGRALNYVTFAISSCLAGVFLSRKADVIYCYHPPITTGLSGAAISLLRRTPLVYDIQDLWPDTLQATGMMNAPLLLNTVERVCRVVYRRAAALVVLSPGFKRELSNRGVPDEKIEVIYNWCDESSMATKNDVGEAPQVMANRFNVVFAGTMGKAQALDAVISAAELVAHQCPRVQFVFVGGGIEIERLKALAAQRAPDNVVFLPRMPMNEIGCVLNAADALLVHLKDAPLFSITVPSKTQAYMAVGKPVVMAVRGDAADLISQSGGGVLAEPENPESIAAAVLRLAAMQTDELNRMGRLAADFYTKNLSIRTGVEKFIRVFSRVAQRK